MSDRTQRETWVGYVIDMDASPVVLPPAAQPRRPYGQRASSLPSQGLG